MMRGQNSSLSSQQGYFCAIADKSYQPSTIVLATYGDPLFMVRQPGGVSHETLEESRLYFFAVWRKMNMDFNLEDYLERSREYWDRKRDSIIIYDGGYIRLITDGVIEIDNPQESLIKKIVIEKDWIGAFTTYLQPHKMDMENLKKIYEMIYNAGTIQTRVNLRISSGIRDDNSFDDAGVFLNIVDINFKGKEEILFNNYRLREGRILGKSSKYANAVLNAISEAFDAIKNGLLEDTPETQWCMMQNVGWELQALYQREQGMQQYDGCSCC
jgi:hypothetical protein